MAPKVLLIFQAPKRRKFYINTLPPLGILGIISYLQKNNILADVIDYNVEDRTNLDLKRYDIIGLSLNMANISNSLDFINYLKEQNPKVKIIVGGPSCISNPLYFTRNENIDAICTGEGEEAMYDYIRQGGFTDDTGIPGLYTRGKKGHFIYGGDRPYLDNLDKLPFPALNKVSLDKYRIPLSKSFPISSIITSRGCPFHCIFCFHTFGYKWRPRSSTNVVDEVEWQVKELGVREICIQDDNFCLDLNRAKEIFDLILKRDIKVKLQFQNGIRVDNVDFEVLNKMHRAGVWLVGLAPETGSLRMIEKIKKDVDLDKIRQVVQWCQKIGMNTYAYFMIGFPSETMLDLEQTAFLIENLNTDFMQISRLIPFPRTPLYTMIVDEGIENSFGQEQGCFFGIPRIKISEISDRQLKRLIKQIHRSFYLKFSRMVKLIKILPPLNLIKLFIYSIRTKNV